MEKQEEFKVAAHVYSIPIDLIRPFKDQPRKHFDESGLELLSGSMEEYDQQEPIKVRKIKDPKYQFELIDGERRFRSARLAGLKEIQAIIRKVRDEDEQFAISLILNFGKKKHTDLEAADAINRLKVKNGMSEIEIAKMLGQSQSWVNQHAWLSKLIPEVREMMSRNLPKRNVCPFLLRSKSPRWTPNFKFKEQNSFWQEAPQTQPK